MKLCPSRLIMKCVLKMTKLKWQSSLSRVSTSNNNLEVSKLVSLVAELKPLVVKHNRASKCASRAVINSIFPEPNINLQSLDLLRVVLTFKGVLN